MLELVNPEPGKSVQRVLEQSWSGWKILIRLKTWAWHFQLVLNCWKGKVKTVSKLPESWDRKPLSRASQGKRCVWHMLQSYGLQHRGKFGFCAANLIWREYFCVNEFEQEKPIIPKSWHWWSLSWASQCNATLFQLLKRCRVQFWGEFWLSTSNWF